MYDKLKKKRLQTDQTLQAGLTMGTPLFYTTRVDATDLADRLLSLRTSFVSRKAVCTVCHLIKSCHRCVELLLNNILDSKTNY